VPRRVAIAERNASCKLRPLSVASSPAWAGPPALNTSKEFAAIAASSRTDHPAAQHAHPSSQLTSLPAGSSDQWANHWMSNNRSTRRGSKSSFRNYHCSRPGLTCSTSTRSQGCWPCTWSCPSDSTLGRRAQSSRLVRCGSNCRRSSGSPVGRNRRPDSSRRTHRCGSPSLWGSTHTRLRPSSPSRPGSTRTRQHRPSPLGSRPRRDRSRSIPRGGSHNPSCSIRPLRSSRSSCRRRHSIPNQLGRRQMRSTGSQIPRRHRRSTSSALRNARSRLANIFPARPWSRGSRARRRTHRPSDTPRPPVRIQVPQQRRTAHRSRVRRCMLRSPDKRRPRDPENRPDLLDLLDRRDRPGDIRLNRACSSLAAPVAPVVLQGHACL
jgi:hypothetical protein